MTTHELKTDPAEFDAIADGLKTFEIRYNDRNYKVGDQLILNKTRYSHEEMKQGKPLEYLDSYGATVSHILYGPCFGLADGWVIMSLQP
jgi:ASC-1-like (ASCH) protein